MNRGFYAGLVASTLLFIHTVSTWADDIKPLKTIQIGKADNRQITCQVRVVHTSLNGGTTEVCLRFQAVDHAGEQKIFDVVAGECSSDPNSFSVAAEDYVGLGHRQIFVCASYGRTTSYLCDCDGSEVRTLYKREEGRDEVRFTRGRHGRWRLAEYWRYDQYPDEDELGTAFVVYPPKGHVAGKVVRMLHWNDSQFVPDLPGPSKIVTRPHPHA